MREYLTAYAKVTRRITRADVTYIDLFAGPGRDRSRETREAVDGSPLIALGLYPGFRRFVFVDVSPENTRELSTLATEKGLLDRCRILTGDCNAVVDSAMSAVPRGDGAVFCFIDPASLDVHWATIKCIAEHRPPPARKIELFILFPYDMDLVRFLTWERRPEDIWGTQIMRRIDLAMPDTVRWRQVWEARNQGDIGSPEARRRFAYLYWMGLRELGYTHVPNPKLLYTPDRRPLYFLFFASDHAVGGKIMSHILTRPRESEQLRLPIGEDPWDFQPGEAWYADTSG